MKNLILLCLSALTFASCNKEITSLPELTESGINSFGAKIDGNLWGPAQGIAFNSTTVKARFSADTSVFINAYNFASSPTETEMEIFIKNLRGPGTYYLNENTMYYPHHTASYARFEKRKFQPVNQWMTSGQLGGWVNITKFDIPNRIISGTFEFKAQSLDSSVAPITVSEGRFDVKIQ